MALCCVQMRSVAVVVASCVLCKVQAKLGFMHVVAFTTQFDCR